MNTTKIPTRVTGSPIEPSTQVDIESAIGSEPMSLSKYIKTAYAYYLDGLDALDNNELDEAIDAFTVCLALEGELYLARYQLARVFMQQNRSELARLTIKPFLSLPLDSPYHYVGVALMAIIDNDVETADYFLHGALNFNNGQDKNITVICEELLEAEKGKS